MTILQYRGIWTGLLLIAALMVISPGSEARMNAGFIEDLTRATAKVADNVPIQYSDDLASLGKSKRVQGSVDADLVKTGKLSDNMSDAARQAARSAEVLAQLKRGLSANPKLLKQVDQLDEAGRQTAWVLVKGGERLTAAVPDIAIRGKLLRGGGADFVANAGLYGDDFVKNALRMQTALDAGALAVPAGKRAVTLANFTETISKLGKGGLDFFNNTIKPHWKVWVGSGLFTWWVLDPDGFQDTAGQITHEGTKRIAELAGEIAAGTVSGTIEGSGNAMADIGSRTWSAFREHGVAGVFGVLLVLALGSLAFGRVRYYALAPLRWLNKTPEDDG
jgi:hypothetical protein